jgi:hypothetical protein
LTEKYQKSCIPPQTASRADWREGATVRVQWRPVAAFCFVFSPFQHHVSEMTAEQYGGAHETASEREEKVKKLNLSVVDLFDTSRPWLLVTNGSLLGYFDFVSHFH